MDIYYIWILLVALGIPNQIKAECMILPVPPHGHVLTTDGTKTGSIATYVCDPGYTLTPSNKSSLLCTETGRWKGWPPVCIETVTPATLPPASSTSVPTTVSPTTQALTTESSTSSSYTLSTVAVTHSTTVNPTPSSRTSTSTSISYTTTPASSEATTTTPTPTADCGTKMKLRNGTVDYSNGTTYLSKAVFSCNDGYIMKPKNPTPATCEANGKWTYSIPYCQIKDCGEPKNTTYGNYTLTNGTTTYGSTVMYYCEFSYLYYTFELTCGPTGKWIGGQEKCPEVCDEPKTIAHGYYDLQLTVDTGFGFSLFYYCDNGYNISGERLLKCGSDNQWIGKQPKCIHESDIRKCPNNMDDRGITWHEANAGYTAVIMCNTTTNGTGLNGKIERMCGDNGVWETPRYNCIRHQLQDLENTIKDLKHNPTDTTVGSALDKLATATNVTETDGGLSEWELQTVTTMLENIAIVSNKTNLTEAQTQAFIGTASNLLDTTNQNAWRAVSDSGGNDKSSQGAAKVLQVIDTYAAALAKSGKTQTIKRTNIVLQVAKVDKQTRQDGIHFPPASMDISSTKSSINLGFPDLTDVSSYSAVLYKNLSGILPSSTGDKKATNNYEINSAVLSLDIHQQNQQPQNDLDVTIVLEHFQKELRHPLCSFWNTERYQWDSTGCRLQSSNSSISICKCTHLTNFAILMSPWTEDNVVSRAIDIISIIGCSVSMIGLLVTVVFHVVLWRYMKSDRIVILMHLSVALVISYAIFLGGVDRTENKGACTAIAVLLQYIYLVVFFLMLAEGIELAVTILYVFITKSRIKWMLPLAWGLPAVIVGISLAATQTEGYGTKDFCWLSVEDGLIWSFVGPALLIITINIILLILVMRAMFKARTLSQKSAKEKVKTGVRSLCILLPLMGCSWILGIFYVNKEFVWVQYVFAVCNSLQGFIIFFFHCATNIQIRGALRRQRKKYYDSRSMSSGAAKPMTTPRASSTISGNGRTSTNSITGFHSYEEYPNQYLEMRNPSYMRASISL